MAWFQTGVSSGTIHKMNFETRFYLVIAFIALGLMLAGHYLLSLEGILNAISGIICLISGAVLGVIVFGDRWEVF